MLGSLAKTSTFASSLSVTSEREAVSGKEFSRRFSLVSRLARVAGYPLSPQELPPPLQRKKSVGLPTLLKDQGIKIAELETQLPPGLYQRLCQIWCCGNTQDFNQAVVELGEELSAQIDTRELGLVTLAWAQEHAGAEEIILKERAQAAEQKALGVGLTVSERVHRVAQSAQHAMGDQVGLGSMLVGQGFGMVGKYAGLRFLKGQPAWLKVLGSGTVGLGFEGAGFVVGHGVLGQRPQDLGMALKGSYGMLGSLRLGGGLVNGGLSLLGKGILVRQVGSKLGMAAGLSLWHGYGSAALGLGQHLDPMQGIVEDFVAFEAMGGVLGLSSTYRGVQRRFNAETQHWMQNSRTQLAGRLARIRTLRNSPKNFQMGLQPQLASANGVPPPGEAWSMMDKVPEHQRPSLMGWFGKSRSGGEELAGEARPSSADNGATIETTTLEVIGRWGRWKARARGFWHKTRVKFGLVDSSLKRVGIVRQYFHNPSGFGVGADAYWAMVLYGETTEVPDWLIDKEGAARFSTWIESASEKADGWFEVSRFPGPLSMISGKFGQVPPLRPGEGFTRDAWLASGDGYRASKDFAQASVARWRYLRKYLDARNTEAEQFFISEVAKWVQGAFPKGFKAEAVETVLEEYYIREFPEEFVAQWKELRRMKGEKVPKNWEADRKAKGFVERFRAMKKKVGEAIKGEAPIEERIYKVVDDDLIEKIFLEETADSQWMVENVGEESRKETAEAILTYCRSREAAEQSPMEEFYAYGDDMRPYLSREQLDNTIVMVEEMLTRLEAMDSPQSRQALRQLLLLAQNKIAQEGTHMSGKDVLDPDFKWSDIKTVSRHPYAGLYQRTAKALTRLHDAEALPLFAQNAAHSDPFIAAASLRGLAQLAAKGPQGSRQEATRAFFTRGLQATYHTEAEHVATPRDLAVAMENLAPEWWEDAQNKSQAWIRAVEKLDRNEEGAGDEVTAAWKDLAQYLEQMRYQAPRQP